MTVEVDCRKIDVQLMNNSGGLQVFAPRSMQFQSFGGEVTSVTVVSGFGSELHSRPWTHHQVSIVRAVTLPSTPSS